MVEPYPPLLITKVYLPGPRGSHIARPQLVARLEVGRSKRLTLIAAAAGFGKTTLAADWCQMHQGSVCWLSLDEGDNDPARFLSYVIAAVQTRHPEIGRDLLAALTSAQPPSVENALYALINQMAALHENLTLVLDDYHRIENQAVHAALEFLLDHLSSQVHLFLLTRSDPPLPLARLRAKNDLLELRAAELRFSPEEAGRFLREAMSIDLPPGAIRALEKRTEGWIAGLQLAAIAMQNMQSDKSMFIEQFTGSHRFVLDYLMEEVLSRQPEDVRRFLLQTSVLSRLNGALCGSVTGEEDGQAMLETLERENLFLIPLDQSRVWYRYHHLFADLLRARLQAEAPDTIKALQSRAAHWHEENGLPEEAIPYALEAQDFEYAADLITGPAVSITRRGEVATLLDWYRSFPPEFVGSHPSLGLGFGMAFALNGRWDEAETLLKAVEAGYGAEFRPDEVLLLSYLVASQRRDREWLDVIEREAAAHVQRSPATKLVLALVISLKGDLRRACGLLTEAEAVSERDNDLAGAMTALFHLCRFQVYLGNFHQANELIQRALQKSQALGGAALPLVTLAHGALGRILVEWNEPEAAKPHLQEAIRLAERSGFVTGVVSSSMMMLAEIQQALGDSEGANVEAEKAIQLAERYDPPAEVTWLKTYQARLWLTQGNTASAGDWLREAATQSLPQSLFYPPGIDTVTQARALLARRKIDEAIRLLTELTTQPHNILTVEALNVLALARQAQGDHVHALLTLEQAMPLAEAENRIRAFLELGAPMAKLLAYFCEAHPENDFARRVLKAFPAPSENAQTVQALNERELDVLRLIVAGYSNDEIAHKLTLAVSTVKWYINVLYGKLHVKTRAQAIARTHDLRLLE